MKKTRVLVNALLIASLVLLLVGPLTVSAAPQSATRNAACSQYYTIRWGDTLYRIAVRFGTTVGTLMRLNGISSANRIIAGRTICVRAGYVPPPAGGFFYTVRWGDTLNRIAARYGWSTGFLALANNIANPNRIYPGQRLWIPYH